MADSDVVDMLPVAGGRLTLDASSAPGDVLADQLARCTGGSPIVVRGAVRAVEGGAVTVRGEADFLGVAGVPVTARAAAGATGEPVVTVRFHLIDGAPGPNPWTFSRSFPALPGLYAGSSVAGGRASARPHLLDTLVLSDAAFVIATGEGGTDAATGAPLSRGLSFVSRCTPTGLLGLLGSLLRGGGALPLYGPIVLPKAAELTLPAPNLPLLRYPWQAPGPIPGINLVADLGIDEALGRALRLHAVGLRIYTPATKGWAEQNPTYAPALAASAKLDVPSAGLSLDASVIGVDDVDGLVLFGLFEGLSVGKLAHLIDLAGGDDLATILPGDVQSALGAVGKLSLLGLSLQLGPGFSVERADLSVGIPDLGTEVLPGFRVDRLLASFGVSDPFGANRALSALLGGGVAFAGAPFDVGIRLPEVEATARLKDDVTLPLSRAFDSLGLPAPPDLDVSQMQLDVDRAGNFSFAALMAESPPWALDLGPTSLTVSGVSVLASRPSGAGAYGVFGGTLALGEGLELATAYDTREGFVLRAALPDASLTQLARALTDQSVSLPGGFDLALTGSTVMIQQASFGLVCQLATTMQGLGTVAFEVRRVSAGKGAWGFAAGVDLTGLRLSSLPGLSALSAFESAFALDQLVLVVATFDDTGFTFPALAAFKSPTLRTGGLTLPAQAGGVVSGLNAYARWTLDSASREHELLRKLLGLDPAVGITLQVGTVPSQNSRLYVSFATTLSGMPLSCTLGGQIKDGEVGLFMNGTLQANIQGQPVRFDVTTLFVANGAFVSGSMLGSIAFEGLTLSNLALVIGVNWEAIPSLGIAATLSGARFQTSLAVFFDSVDPSRSLLAGAVSDLSLRDVVDTFARSTAPAELRQAFEQAALLGTSTFSVGAELAAALDNLQLDAISAAFAQHGVALPSSSSQVLLVVGRAGRRWFLTDMATMLHYALVASKGQIQVSLDPQFYCVPQATSLGTLRFEQGTFINTRLKLWAFDATAKVLIKPAQGVSVDGTMARLVIGTEQLFSVTSADGKAGPRVSAATFTQPGEKDPALKGPHFLIDGRVSLLGLERQLYVSVSPRGFEFEMKGSLTHDASYDLEGSFDGPTKLRAGGAIVVEVGTLNLGPLGKVTIASGVKGSLDVGVKGSTIQAKFTGGFEFAGQHFDLPEIDLDVHTASLPGLPGRVVELAPRALEGFLKDATRWARLVHDGLIAGVQDVAGVLKQFFGKTTAAAATVMRAARYAADQVGRGIQSAYGATSDQAAKALKSAGYTATEVGGALKAVYGETADEAAKLLKGAGYTVNQIGDALRGAWGATASEVGGALKEAGYAVDQVGSYLKDAFHLGPDNLKNTLEGVGFSPSSIETFFNDLGGAFADVFEDVGDHLDPNKW